MNAQNLKVSLRTPQALESLDTVLMADIAKEINPKEVRLVHHNGTGNTYCHLVTADNSYLSIKVSTKCNLESADDAGKMRELVTSFPIYTGDTDINGAKVDRWFTFAPKAAQRITTVVPFADLIKGSKFTAALVG